MYLINKIINITFKKYMIKLAIQIQNSKMDLESYASIIIQSIKSKSDESIVISVSFCIMSTLNLNPFLSFGFRFLMYNYSPSRVICDRVLNKKNYFEIPTFLPNKQENQEWENSKYCYKTCSLCLYFHMNFLILNPIHPYMI